MRDATTDGPTRSTRLAANAAALAVVAFAALWFATTQVRSIREVSPFADDPWDAVASYAAIFLPLVAGATWIRSIRHRGPILPPVTAARIRWGAGLAVGIVLASVAADLLAIATATPLAAAPGNGRPALIVFLVALAGLAASLAMALLVRAGFVARAARTDRTMASGSPGPTPSTTSSRSSRTSHGRSGSGGQSIACQERSSGSSNTRRSARAGIGSRSASSWRSARPSGSMRGMRSSRAAGPLSGHRSFSASSWPSVCSRSISVPSCRSGCSGLRRGSSLPPDRAQRSAPNGRQPPKIL